MRLAHHLLRHPSGMWHFRIAVPRDLQATFGLRVIKRSLKTHDPVLAKRFAYVFGARYAQAFAEARGKGCMGSDFDDYLKSLRRFEIEPKADGGYPQDCRPIAGKRASGAIDSGRRREARAGRLI